jgi:heme exporter protein A
VVKNFGPPQSSQGVHFSLESGEIAAVMGRNGAGKSTFLRIAATLLKMDQGSLSYFDTPLQGNEKEIRSQLGVSLHTSMLYSNLTAEENLAFFARMYGVRDVDKRLDEVFQLIHFNERRKQRVGTLSRGLEQRLALGRAMLHRPRILLLDEPFTGLDLDSLLWVEETLLEFRNQGGSVIFVSHDFERILPLAHSIYVLHSGLFSKIGTSHEK